ncbi:transposase [Streptomyces sp. NPDC088748]|uniref:transposase n=1 Tax=Streptomyces sp. NPDC088748 TaxID=3365887 RepID=UPI003802A701
MRTLFAQPTAEAVRTHLDTVADMLGCQFPKVKDMLLEAKEDLTAFADFPHQSSTTNGSSSPAATSPPKAWTASIQTPEPACPAPPSDQLHHHKGHDPTLLLCWISSVATRCPVRTRGVGRNEIIAVRVSGGAGIHSRALPSRCTGAPQKNDTGAIHACIHGVAKLLAGSCGCRFVLLGGTLAGCGGGSRAECSESTAATV